MKLYLLFLNLLNLILAWHRGHFMFLPLLFCFSALSHYHLYILYGYGFMRVFSVSQTFLHFPVDIGLAMCIIKGEGRRSISKKRSSTNRPISMNIAKLIIRPTRSGSTLRRTQQLSRSWKNSRIKRTISSDLLKTTNKKISHVTSLAAERERHE